MRSPYSFDNPPPVEPPLGTVAPSLWKVQRRQWKRHRPDKHGQCRAHECRVARLPWPCAPWESWDHQLLAAVITARRLLAAILDGTLTVPQSWTPQERGRLGRIRARAGQPRRRGRAENRPAPDAIPDPRPVPEIERIEAKP